MCHGQSPPYLAGMTNIRACLFFFGRYQQIFPYGESLCFWRVSQSQRQVLLFFLSWSFGDLALKCAAFSAACRGKVLKAGIGKRGAMLVRRFFWFRSVSCLLFCCVFEVCLHMYMPVHTKIPIYIMQFRICALRRASFVLRVQKAADSTLDACVTGFVDKFELSI